MDMYCGEKTPMARNFAGFLEKKKYIKGTVGKVFEERSVSVMDTSRYLRIRPTSLANNL